MKIQTRRGLAWRLYLIGFVQLIVLGAALPAVGWVLRLDVRQPPPLSTNHAPLIRDPWFPDEGEGRAPPGPPSPVAPLLSFFLSGLVIVGVGAFLTARWIVRPLETLSRTARALGSGDMRARTGLNRSDELGEVGRAFDDMAERVQGLLLAERELLANVSHELRTPLARIRVALDLADEGNADAGTMSIAEINRDLTEIEDLINDIMTTVRLELESGQTPSSGLSLKKVRVSPAEICTRAAERFRVRHPTRPLESSADASLSAVQADPALVRRALDNLLENADKYSPDLRGQVMLHAHAAEGGVAFDVADEGMGISDEDLPRVFAPFFRSERSRSRGTGGVGLGLTLAKRIVEAHGGTIVVTSAVGFGTTVRMTLPFANGE